VSCVGEGHRLVAQLVDRIDVTFFVVAGVGERHPFAVGADRFSRRRGRSAGGAGARGCGEFDPPARPSSPHPCLSGFFWNSSRNAPAELAVCGERSMRANWPFSVPWRGQTSTGNCRRGPGERVGEGRWRGTNGLASPRPALTTSYDVRSGRRRRSDTRSMRRATRRGALGAERAVNNLFAMARVCFDADCVNVRAMLRAETRAVFRRVRRMG